jgi:hypothetical protein
MENNSLNPVKKIHSLKLQNSIPKHSAIHNQGRVGVEDYMQVTVRSDYTLCCLVHFQ